MLKRKNTMGPGIVAGGGGGNNGAVDPALERTVKGNKLMLQQRAQRFVFDFASPVHFLRATTLTEEKASVEAESGGGVTGAPARLGTTPSRPESPLLAAKMGGVRRGGDPFGRSKSKDGVQNQGSDLLCEDTVSCLVRAPTFASPLSSCATTHNWHGVGSNPPTACTAHLPTLQVVSRVASLVRKGESLSTVMVGPKETRGARRAALFGLTTEVEVQVSSALGTVLSLHLSIAVPVVV